jgi:hypothetical protein
MNGRVTRLWNLGGRDVSLQFMALLGPAQAMLRRQSSTPGKTPLATDFADHMT